MQLSEDILGSRLRHSIKRLRHFHSSCVPVIFHLLELVWVVFSMNPVSFFLPLVRFMLLLTCQCLTFTSWHNPTCLTDFIHDLHIWTWIEPVWFYFCKTWVNKLVGWHFFWMCKKIWRSQLWCLKTAHFTMYLSLAMLWFSLPINPIFSVH